MMLTHAIAGSPSTSSHVLAIERRTTAFARLFRSTTRSHEMISKSSRNSLAGAFFIFAKMTSAMGSLATFAVATETKRAIDRARCSVRGPPTSTGELGSSAPLALCVRTLERISPGMSRSSGIRIVISPFDTSFSAIAFGSLSDETSAWAFLCNRFSRPIAIENRLLKPGAVVERVRGTDAGRPVALGLDSLGLDSGFEFVRRAGTAGPSMFRVANSS